VGQATNDDNFSEEIQDIGIVQTDSIETTEKIFSVQYGKDSEWFDFKK
jgi:hypothetical protein